MRILHFTQAVALRQERVGMRRGRVLGDEAIWLNKSRGTNRASGCMAARPRRTMVVMVLFAAFFCFFEMDAGSLEPCCKLRRGKTPEILAPTGLDRLALVGQTLAFLPPLHPPNPFCSSLVATTYAFPVLLLLICRLFVDLYRS